MDKNVKNGQNDEMDEATASLSSRRVLGAAARGLVCLNRHICWYSIGGPEGPDIKILIIFYFTCTTSTLTCITLVTLVPQPVTTRTHTYTNPGWFNTIPAHMCNTPSEYHATSPSSF